MADERGAHIREFDADGSEAGPDSVRILPDDSHHFEPYQSDAQSRPVGSPDQPSVPAHSLAGARRGPSACLIMSITFSLLALSCAVLAFGALREGLNGFSRLTGIIPNFGISLVTTPTVTIDTSRPSVIQSVRALSKLETVHYELEKVISGKSAGPLPDFLTSDKILLVAHGEVVAGVDLSTIRAEAVKVETSTITITMPKPEIVYSKLDNDKTYVYDRQTGIFSKPDPNLESELRATAEEQIKQAALEDGILTKADQNARQAIKTLLNGLGYDNIQFAEEP